jgi:Carboxypeptidase regulatory-like domain
MISLRKAPSLKIALIAIGFSLVSGFAQSTISGTIENDKKQPVAGAKVTLRDSHGANIQGPTSANAAGEFQFGPVPADTYKISVDADGWKPQDQNITIAATPIKLQFSLQPAPPGFETSVYWIGGLLIVFWIAVLTARYHNIATVNRHMLSAEINKARQRAIAILSMASPITRAQQDAHDRAQALICEAAKLTDKARKEYFRTFLYWTRGHEISAWRQLHEADRFVVQTYDLCRTVARLRIAVQELRPDYAKVADLVEAALDTPSTAKPTSEEYLKALLLEALDCVYDGVDNSYEMIFTWQNKSFTLLFVAGCVLLVVASTSYNALLMLMGLAGGLVSRLWRGARGTEIPHDYGANWTTLIMSPIYGAFAGWFGVLMLVALKSVGVLGAAFDSLKWGESFGQPLPLALAFLFGFSERSFTTVADSLETAVKDNLRKSVASTDNSKPDDKSSTEPNQPKPPLPSPQITSLPYARPGRTWTIEGENLGGIQKVELVGAKPVPLKLLSKSDEKLELDVGADVTAGQYDLQLDGTKVGGKVTVPTWTINQVRWSGNTLTVDGSGLTNLPELLMKSAVIVPLTKSASATETQVTATASEQVKTDSYHLIAGDIPTGDTVKVP